MIIFIMGVMFLLSVGAELLMHLCLRSHCSMRGDESTRRRVINKPAIGNIHISGAMYGEAKAYLICPTNSLNFSKS